MSLSNLGALIHIDPSKAKAQILEAISKTKGDRKKAAELLGTTHRSFYRFIERLHLWDAIDKLIDENGWPKIPGPPRVSQRMRDMILLERGNLKRAAKSLDLTESQLETRLTEMDLWDDVNRRLAAAGIARLKKPATVAA